MKAREKNLSTVETEEGLGVLPPLAPLANPFVPFQTQNASQYEARKGMIRGTIFPDLDLPFMNLVNETEKPDTLLSQLQTLNFAITELSLYLDTHREDYEALELYRTYQHMYLTVKKQYEKDIGPLDHSEPGEGEYHWLNDPWPWEYCANQEA